MVGTGPKQFRFADGSTENYDAEPFADGKEGDVYRSLDQRHAIKIYKPDPTLTTQQRRERIQKLITKYNPVDGDPYWEEFFTWPDKLVESPGLGLRMRFAGGMKTLDHYIFGKSYKRLRPEERGWFIGKIAVAIKLASAAERMASKGLCYPDFSHRNVMVDPYEGRMTLIDCDSLVVPGDLDALIEGTSWYRAPEIIMRTVKTPSVLSDRHSLAVILYLWLLNWHPFYGDKTYDPDPTKDEDLRLGARALYIEHPTDHSNRATGRRITAHDLGPEVERLFKEAFVDYLYKPNLRPRADAWQAALRHAYDRLIPCSSAHCEWRFFVARPEFGLRCPDCAQRVTYPKTLPFFYLLENQGRSADINLYKPLTQDTSCLVGWPGKTIQGWHVNKRLTPFHQDPSHSVDASALAVIDYDPNSSSWVVKNQNLPSMRYRLASSQPDAWTPWTINEVKSIQDGMVIQFGDAPEHNRAEIKVVNIA